MPEDNPSFSTKAVGAKKPRRRVERRRASTSGSPKRRELDRQLTSIYEDRNGRLPNMREIDIKKDHPVLNFFIGLIVIGGLLSALAWAGFFFFPGDKKLSDDKISLEVIGPQTVELAATTTYTIIYKNNQTIGLKNATLNINYPEGFAFLEASVSSSNAGHTEWQLGPVAAGDGGKISITGRNFGALNQKFSWRVFLNYTPENFASEMKKAATLDTQIDSSPYALTLVGPDQTAMGNDTEYTFKLNRSDGWQPDKLEIVPIIPANFYSSSSSPALDKAGRWVIDFKNVTSTSSTSEMIFKLRGKFADAGDNSTAAKIGAAVYLPLSASQNYQIASAEVNTELIKSTLTFNLVANGSMNNFSSMPGDVLNITLHLLNTSPDTLNKGQIKLIIDGPSANKLSALSWKNIDDKLNGDITGEQLSNTARRGTILWTKKHLADLSAVKTGGEINIDLKLPIKTLKEFDWSATPEYKITLSAEAAFTDKTGAEVKIPANPIVITLNSDLKFEARDEIKRNSDDQDVHNLDWILTNSHSFGRSLRRHFL